MPCSRGPPVLLLCRARPVEPALLPQGLEPARGGVPGGLQPHVEVPSEEHGPCASRAFGRRVHGQASPEGRLRRPRVAAAAWAVDVDDREGATRGHHIKSHGLAEHDGRDVSNFLRGEHVRPKGNQEPAAHRCRQRCLGIDPRERMIPMVTPLILRVHHALGVLQACLLEEAQDGTLGLHMPAAAASPSSIPGATGTPSPRIEPWTFQDTAARVSEAGPLQGCAVGPGPPPDPDHWTQGPPAPGARGWRDGPCLRGSPPEVAAAG